MGNGVNSTKQEDMLTPDDPPTQKTTMLEVNVKAFNNVGAPFLYHINLQVKRLYHMSDADCVIQFWLKGSLVLRCSRDWTTVRDRRYHVTIQALQMSLVSSFVCYPMKLYVMMSTQSLVGSRL